jgi:hypothetical protein
VIRAVVGGAAGWGIGLAAYPVIGLWAIPLGFGLSALGGLLAATTIR